ncbi:unnamed protein product [Ascophyllum nodosum]
MGNNGSFMEKVYVYLPVLMCHSRMDYKDAVTVRNIRLAYGLEQVAIFAFTAYFVLAIRRRHDKRRILVPDISQKQMFMKIAPPPDQMTYRPSTYFEFEMTEVFQQLQQAFFALLFTILLHFIFGIKPILLLQIFSTPYHFIENRLFRKHVLGLKAGYRVWGERFDGEVEVERIKGEGAAEASEGTVATESDARVVMETNTEEVDGSMPVANQKVVEARADTVTGESTGSIEAAEQQGVGALPMPKALEDALIDAWDAAEDADWGKVVEQVGPFSVNTQTPVERWTPLMVACGLTKVGEEEVKALVSDMEARVDLRDEGGWTCLHWAAQQGRAGAVRAVFEGIRENSSEPSAASATIAELLALKDNAGKTAADVARDSSLEGAALEALLDALSLGAEGRNETEGADGSLAELD